MVCILISLRPHLVEFDHKVSISLFYSFLFRQPMGVLALLDEECLFPKGSDKSYLEKLNKTHADKSSNYIKAEKSRAQKEEFEIAHYAGTV